MTAPTAPAPAPAAEAPEPVVAPEPVESAEVVTDLLVEDVSIDGMCGVY